MVQHPTSRLNGGCDQPGQFSMPLRAVTPVTGQAVLLLVTRPTHLPTTPVVACVCPRRPPLGYAYRRVRTGGRRIVCRSRARRRARTVPEITFRASELACGRSGLATLERPLQRVARARNRQVQVAGTFTFHGGGRGRAPRQRHSHAPVQRSHIPRAESRPRTYARDTRFVAKRLAAH